MRVSGLICALPIWLLASAKHMASRGETQAALEKTSFRSVAA